jgi:hypothetical protein
MLMGMELRDAIENGKPFVFAVSQFTDTWIPTKCLDVLIEFTGEGSNEVCHIWQRVRPVDKNSLPWEYEVPDAWEDGMTNAQVEKVTDKFLTLSWMDWSCTIRKYRLPLAQCCKLFMSSPEAQRKGRRIKARYRAPKNTSRRMI